MHQVIKLSARQGSAAANYADLLRDGELADHHRDSVGVLEIENARRAIGECAREALAGGDAGVAVEPLDGASYVGERSAILTVRVELGLVIDDQTLVLADRGGSAEHCQRKLAGGSAVIADGKVGARNQSSLARNRRDAVRIKDLRVEYLGCRGTHATGGAALGEPIQERGIPCVAHAGILDVKTKQP